MLIAMLGYTFRFFHYQGRSEQVAVLFVDDKPYDIQHNDWVLFNCQKTHSCMSSDWMSFAIWGCDYRYRLESFGKV